MGGTRKVVLAKPQSARRKLVGGEREGGAYERHERCFQQNLADTDFRHRRRAPKVRSRIARVARCGLTWVPHERGYFAAGGGGNCTTWLAVGGTNWAVGTGGAGLGVCWTGTFRVGNCGWLDFKLNSILSVGAISNPAGKVRVAV